MDWGAETGDDVWLISQMKAGAKKETEEENERKSCSRVCYSRSRTALSCFLT